VLWVGHALNALAPLTTYALAARLARQPWAGVAAAAVVASIAYMPAYYVSWGRYTQLMGLVMLAPLWMLTEQSLSAARDRATAAATLGLLAAGLALTHYRVLAFYMVYVILRLLAFGLEAGRARWRGRSPLRLAHLAPLAGGALLALLLIGPWAARFIAVARLVVPDVYGGWEMPAVVEDAIPLALLRYGWTPHLLAVAALGALWAALRRQRDLLVLALWCGALLLLANPQVLGLAKVWFISNGPVIISFWLPCAVLAGWLAADGCALLGEWFARRRNSSALCEWASALLAVSLLGLAGWGAWRTVDVVNPSTVLVKPEDLQAMVWVREHTPAEARFLINTRPWMNEVRMGVDGGWWLPLLGERPTNLPCILYTQGPADYRQAIQELAAAVEANPTLDDATLLARLREAGITHIYLGALPGPMTARVLDAHPLLEALYVQGPLRVYALKPGTP